MPCTAVHFCCNECLPFLPMCALLVALRPLFCTPPTQQVRDGCDGVARPGHHQARPAQPAGCGLRSAAESQAAGSGCFGGSSKVPGLPTVAQAGPFETSVQGAGQLVLRLAAPPQHCAPACAGASQARQGQTVGCSVLSMPQSRITWCTTPSVMWVSASPGAAPVLLGGKLDSLRLPWPAVHCRAYPASLSADSSKTPTAPPATIAVIHKDPKAIKEAAGASQAREQ